MKVKFKGIDDWNRPVFKAIDQSLYYGSVDILFDYDATEEEVLQKVTAFNLSYFGHSFNCEPYGDSPKEPLEIVKDGVCGLNCTCDKKLVDQIYDTQSQILDFGLCIIRTNVTDHLDLMKVHELTDIMEFQINYCKSKKLPLNYPMLLDTLERVKNLTGDKYNGK